MTKSWLALVIALSALIAFDGSTSADSSQLTVEGPQFCLQNTDPRDLNTLFDTEPGGLIGADYQRAIALPDGRTLWLFQDAEVRLPNGWTTLVHNVGMLQTRSCFTILMGGTTNDPQPWLFADQTTQFQRWFWGLDAELGSDGRLYIFAVEMLETGNDYLEHTIPQSVHVAAFDPATSAITWTGRPSNSTRDLYGWSITSDDNWTYLYAHCYRQFGFDQLFGSNIGAHDFDCSADVTVARVPKGQLLDALSYWDGLTWQPDPQRAVPVFETENRSINPVQVEWDGERFHAVTKVGDWFGDTIYVERAEQAQGPFQQWSRIPAKPKCDNCNTYFASQVPTQATTTQPGGPITVSLSNNRWDGIITDVYRPAFFTIRRPHPDLLPAQRCALYAC